MPATLVRHSTTTIIDQLMMALTTAMDLDEGEKLYHCWRVAVVADRIAHQMPSIAPHLVFCAGLLHEIGGIGAPMHVLHHARLLEAAQSASGSSEAKVPFEVAYHPYLATEFIRALPGLVNRNTIADIVLQHHEYWDGSGYPNGARGEEISRESLIVAAADMLDICSVCTDDAEAACERFATARCRAKFSPEILAVVETLLHDKEFRADVADEERLHALVRRLYREHREALFSQVKEEEALEGLFHLTAKAIDAKHTYTHGHSNRVSAYSVQIGEFLKLPAEKLELLRLGGFVHDIGKISVPRAILDKTAKLEPEEWRKMKAHARISYDTLSAFPSLETYAFASLHHERWDGKGYPFGLAGEEIPLLARIMAVADSLDAMTSTRSYRQVWTFRHALQDIVERAGSQYDPEIAAVVHQAFLV